MLSQRKWAKQMKYALNCFLLAIFIFLLDFFFQMQYFFALHLLWIWNFLQNIIISWMLDKKKISCYFSINASFCFNKNLWNEFCREYYNRIPNIWPYLNCAVQLKLTEPFCMVLCPKSVPSWLNVLDCRAFGTALCPNIAQTLCN